MRLDIISYPPCYLYTFAFHPDSYSKGSPFCVRTIHDPETTANNNNNNNNNNTTTLTELSLKKTKQNIFIHNHKTSQPRSYPNRYQVYPIIIISQLHQITKHIYTFSHRP